MATATLARTLRLGIAIEAASPFERWHERLLAELSALAGARIDCIALDPAAPPRAFAGMLSTGAFHFDHLITKRRGLGKRPEWRHAAPALTPKEHGGDLDVLIDLRASSAAARHTPASREVWSLDFLRGPPSPEGFSMRVAVAGTGAFSVSLERAATGGFEIIDRAVCSGRPSASRNLEQARQVSIAMILRTLRSRLSGVPERRLSPALPDLPEAGRGESRPGPGMRFATGIVSYAASRGIEDVAIRLASWRGTLPPRFKLYRAHGSPLDFSPEEAAYLGTPQDHYLADPFLIRRNGKLWAFFEVVDNRNVHGQIGVAELSARGLGPVESVLTGETHLSYPHVFDYRNETYMIPETHGRRRVEVWRAVRFPNEWELVSTALEGVLAVDSNLFHDGNKWWLFTNAATDPDSDAGLELSLFEVDGPLLKRLTPHCGNPLVADARFSRNAGRIFSRNGRVFRPAQSLEFGRYGYGLYLMEILKLDPEAYEERPVRFIKGCHHMDSSNDDIIFDISRGASIADPFSRSPPQ